MKRKKTFFAYIRIIETLKFTLQDEYIINELKKSPDVSQDAVLHQDDLLRDFMDGTVYKNNQIFKYNPEALQIILYQDAFENVNPIGSAKKKHKLLAVYMTLGNIPDYLRTHTSTIKLVALCKEIDFHRKKVYGKMVEDLKQIEQEGVEFFGKYLKASLVYITGDNLGSHGLGGFVENSA